MENLNYLMPPLFSPRELFAAQYAFDIDDKATAFEIWKRLADAGNTEAQYNAGICYALGEGVPQDYGAALGLLRQAAAKRHLDAITNIGIMYELGHGVEKDCAKACEFYKVAADAGWGKAQRWLGNMYFDGLGVERNYREAFRLYELAINANPPNYLAYKNLALCYQEGKGIPVDLETAERCFHMAQYKLVTLSAYQSYLIKSRLNKGRKLYESMKRLTARQQDLPDILRRCFKSLKNNDTTERVNAIATMRELRDRRAVEPLIGQLKDPDSFVRFHTCLALGEIGDIRALGSLLECLSDPDQGVRWRAAEALGKMKDSRAVDALLKSLNDSVNTVRHSAALALGQIRDNRAIEPLIQLLGDSDYNTQRGAVWALAQIGKPVVDSIKKVLNDSDKQVRKLAQEVLRSIGDK
jgi:hypothetical protein